MYVESATVDLCYIWGELSCSSALAARAEMRLAALFRTLPHRGRAASSIEQHGEHVGEHGSAPQRVTSPK